MEATVAAKQFLTYDEIAMRWGCCKRTVKRAVDAKLMKASYMMKNPRVSIKEVERYERTVTR